MRITRQVVTHIMLAFGLFTSLNGFTQDRDIHFTQYGMSPLNINPALTGIFNGDQRFTGNYRNQWASVPVNYNTASIAYDQKIYNVKLKNGLFGVGGILNWDRAGDSKLRSITLNLAGSYTQKITQRDFLTVGANLGFAQRGFSKDDLTFDEQFQNGSFDPNNPISESFNTQSKLYPDMGVGINWHFQVPNSKRTQFDLGGAIFHPHSPNVSFFKDEKVNISPRINTQLIGSVKVASKLDLMFNGQLYAQGKSNQAIAGAGVRLHLNEIIGREFAIQLGAEYRFLDKDAWAPVATVYYKQWRVGLSYDFNISDFNVATNGRGGPELGVMYIITKVKPLPIYKSCPIF